MGSGSDFHCSDDSHLHPDHHPLDGPTELLLARRGLPVHVSLRCLAGTSICISEKGLSRVSVYQNLPLPIVWLIDLAMNLLSIVVSGYSVYLSYSIFTQMLKLKMKTSVLSMPLYGFYGFVTLVFTCMTVRFIIKLGMQLTERKVDMDPNRE